MTPADQEHRIHLAGTRAMVAEAARIRAEEAAAPSWSPPPTHCQACGASPADAAKCEHFGICELPSECESEGGET